jgi:hypothetical protein
MPAAIVSIDLAVWVNSSARIIHSLGVRQMKRLLSIFFILIIIVPGLHGQSMDKFFRKPVLEEGDNNIILQNRCGNRLTLMFKADKTELEFTYKPNAFRRKDYWARNFSNRDNQTVLFPRFIMPDIHSNDASYEYDPFVSRIKIKAPSGAKNTITIINIADENAFVISARSPLLVAFSPHVKFDARNGLITEKFSERGEDIVSFIKFPGFEESRFRILRDGTCVLQLLENDAVLIGGEENLYQVDRVTKKFNDCQLSDLISRNNNIIDPFISVSQVFCRNSDFQRVLDINKKIFFSMIDEGGATFGALSRCYYLIWVRDGSMATSLMARAGSTFLLQKWTSLLLNNPSIVRREDGTQVPEFTQILGTRWSKSEDDGLFYALLSLFTTVQTTGNEELLQTNAFKTALESVDRFLDKTWDEERHLIGSDTRGETTLTSSPYYGYDVVNGEMYHSLGKDAVERTDISKSYSLYNQANTYNLLVMTNVLQAKHPRPDYERISRYNKLAELLKESIRTRYVTEKGTLYAGLEIYSDGSEKWVPFGKECDYWEFAWANSLGPYYPVPQLQLASAKEIKRDWTKYRNYGYCPWNTLSRYLYEYGMNSREYEEMLSEQVKDALTQTKKFAMQGAVTEYQKEPEGWRALPFQIGALYYSMTAQVIQSMPMGIGVRASSFVDSVHNYHYRLSRIMVTQTGTGDVVQSFTINNKAIPHSLQIPQSVLRTGFNELRVMRCNDTDEFRLYSSTAELLDCYEQDNTVYYEFYNPVITQFVFDNFEKAHSVKIVNHDGTEISFSKTEIQNMTLIEAQTDGDFRLIVQL